MPEADERPACPRCGVTMFPSRRRMRTHDIEQQKAIPRDKVVETWRCPACGRETPRE